ncbi:MAG TPA: peptidase M14, partial [Bryobacteraceae bacterium]|nr:peptidase M14 [Bryobacteraceae bacterium]
AIKAERELPDAVAGVLLRAKPDQEHWIGHGLPEQLHVLYDGRTIYSPLKTDAGVNPIIFAGPDQVRASGVLWEENRKQLAYKPFVVVQSAGRGTVVGFTADPNFRGFMDGLNVVFLNAVFRSPSGGGRGGAMEENE